jgi:hypothetical protein
MSEVKITVPKGYEVNERLSTADCVVFNRINEREWIDGGKISGYYIDAYCSIKKFDAQGNRDIMDKSVFAEEAQAEGAVALAVLSQQLEHIREGWKPLWKNEEEFKWRIYWNQYTEEFVVFSAKNGIMGGFLVFPSEIMALDFIKINEKEIRQAMIFLQGIEIKEITKNQKIIKAGEVKWKI